MATTVGSVTPQFFADVTLNPTSIPPFTRQTETFTVLGLKTDWVPVVAAPNLESGAFLLGSFVSAANTLKLVFENSTGIAIDPASQIFKVVCF